MSLYKVQTIIGKRQNQVTGKVQYQVKWRGFPRQQSTWEPIKHLSNVKDLIQQYQNKQNLQCKNDNTQHKNKKISNQQKTEVKRQRGRPKQIVKQDKEIKLSKKIVKNHTKNDKKDIKQRDNSVVVISKKRGRPPKKNNNIQSSNINSNNQKDQGKNKENFIVIQSQSQSIQQNGQKSSEKQQVQIQKPIIIEKRKPGRPRKSQNFSFKRQLSLIIQNTQKQKEQKQQKVLVIKSDKNQYVNKQEKVCSQQDHEDKNFIVLQISKRDKDFIFLVNDNSNVRWASHTQLIRQHPLSLISFYQKNIWIEKSRNDGTVQQIKISQMNLAQQIL